MLSNRFSIVLVNGILFCTVNWKWMSMNAFIYCSKTPSEKLPHNLNKTTKSFTSSFIFDNYKLIWIFTTFSIISSRTLISYNFQDHWGINPPWHSNPIEECRNDMWKWHADGDHISVPCLWICSDMNSSCLRKKGCYICQPIRHLNINKKYAFFRKLDQFIPMKF